MRRETDDEGDALIFCVNHNCVSNGGANADALCKQEIAKSTGGAPALTLKPMASAPLPKENEYFQVLVLDQWSEGGMLCRGFKLVYWLDAFDGRPAGWYGNNCGDLRNPQGWVYSTKELPTQ